MQEEVSQIHTKKICKNSPGSKKHTRGNRELAEQGWNLGFTTQGCQAIFPKCNKLGSIPMRYALEGWEKKTLLRGTTGILPLEELTLWPIGVEALGVGLVAWSLCPTEGTWGMGAGVASLPPTPTVNGGPAAASCPGLKSEILVSCAPWSGPGA